MLRAFDCRPANMLCRTPPSTHFATPGSSGLLDLSRGPSWLTANAEDGPDSGSSSEGAYGVGARSISFASLNLPNIYVLTCASQLPRLTCTGFTIQIPNATSLWGLMGWSWSIFYFHSAFTHAMVEAERICGVPAGIACRCVLRDWRAPPNLGTETEILAPRVDNGNHFARTLELVLQMLDALCRELTVRGFAFRIECEGSQSLDVVGLHFNLRELRLSSKPRRAWRLRLATLAL